MEFDISSDQRALQSAARSWFGRHWTTGSLRDVLDGEPLADLRKPLAEVGYLGILADGGTVLDLALVAQEAGRVLAPAPLASAARAVTLLTAASTPHAAGLLGEVIAGAKPLAVLDGTFTLATDGTVTGHSDLSFDVASASSLLLLAEGPHGQVILEVLASAAEYIERPPLDASRDLGGVILREAPAVALDVPDAASVWERARLVATVVLAAEDLGTIERSLEMTVSYAKERRTFGRSIGSYQAVKHVCVDVYVDQELLRSLVWLAAWTADEDPEQLALHASASRSLAVSALDRATDSLIQIHGGIGFTWEHDAHLYWRRSRAGRSLLGDVSTHRDIVARLAMAGAAT